MKKFVFTLKRAYEIKQSAHRQLLSEQGRLKKEMETLEKSREDKLFRMQAQGEKMRAGCEKGVPASQIGSYGDYIAAALREVKQKDEQIAELGLKIEENTGKLLRSLNEIKVMETIREEQMEQYNKELQKNDDKMLEDFLCGRI